MVVCSEAVPFELSFGEFSREMNMSALMEPSAAPQNGSSGAAGDGLSTPRPSALNTLDPARTAIGDGLRLCRQASTQSIARGDIGHDAEARAKLARTWEEEVGGRFDHLEYCHRAASNQGMRLRHRYRAVTEGLGAALELLDDSPSSARINVIQSAHDLGLDKEVEIELNRSVTTIRASTREIGSKLLQVASGLSTHAVRSDDSYALLEDTLNYMRGQNRESPLPANAPLTEFLRSAQDDLLGVIDSKTGQFSAEKLRTYRDEITSRVPGETYSRVLWSDNHKVILGGALELLISAVDETQVAAKAAGTAMNNYSTWLTSAKPAALDSHASPLDGLLIRTEPSPPQGQGVVGEPASTRRLPHSSARTIIDIRLDSPVDLGDLHGVKMQRTYERRGETVVGARFTFTHAATGFSQVLRASFESEPGVVEGGKLEAFQDKFKCLETPLGTTPPGADEQRGYALGVALREFPLSLISADRRGERFNSVFGHSDSMRLQPLYATCFEIGITTDHPDYKKGIGSLPSIFAGRQRVSVSHRNAHAPLSGQYLHELTADLGPDAIDYTLKIKGSSYRPPSGQEACGTVRVTTPTPKGIDLFVALKLVLQPLRASASGEHLNSALMFITSNGSTIKEWRNVDIASVSNQPLTLVFGRGVTAANSSFAASALNIYGDSQRLPDGAAPAFIFDDILIISPKVTLDVPQPASFSSVKILDAGTDKANSTVEGKLRLNKLANSQIEGDTRNLSVSLVRGIRPEGCRFTNWWERAGAYWSGYPGGKKLELTSPAKA